MILFSYTLSLTDYIEDEPGISMLQVDIFAETHEQADKLLDSIKIGNYMIDSVEEF